MNGFPLRDAGITASGAPSLDSAWSSRPTVPHLSGAAGWRTSHWPTAGRSIAFAVRDHGARRPSPGAAGPTAGPTDATRPPRRGSRLLPRSRPSAMGVKVADRPGLARGQVIRRTGWTPRPSPDRRRVRLRAPSVRAPPWALDGGGPAVGLTGWEEHRTPRRAGWTHTGLVASPPSRAHGERGSRLAGSAASQPVSRETECTG